MAHTEIVETSGNFRATIINDECPERPDWDGQTFVLQIGDGYYSRATAKSMNNDGELFAKAFEHFSEFFGVRDAVTAFERYLRIFHGTRSFREFNTGMAREFGYVSFDTAAWRESVGLTDEHMAAYPQNFPYNGEALAEGTLNDWQAWAEGDVWGITVERKLNYVKHYADAPEHDEEGEEWVEIEDSMLWGHYGYDWAVQAAKEALADAVDAEA